jgi:tetratricopeptide (TPR) repeat protein
VARRQGRASSERFLIMEASENHRLGMGSPKHWVVVLSLIAVFGYRVFVEIRGNSATYDEAYFVASGYAILKTGDYRLRKDKPLLSLFVVGAPHLFSDATFSEADPDYKAVSASTGPNDQAQWRFAHTFLHKNRIPAGAILMRSRLAVLVVALLLCLLIYIVGAYFFGPLAGLLSLGLATFCPNILAHAGLATEDMIVTTTFFAAVSSLILYLELPSKRRAIAFGLCLAAGMMSKYTGILLLPVAAVIVAWDRRSQSQASDPWKFLGWTALAFGLLFVVIYRGHVIEYARGFEAARGYISRGQTAFFAGRYSERGFWYYFLAAFTLKTPVPLMLMAPIAAYGVRRKPVGYLLAPVGLLLLAASFTPMQIGHRHILPIYPFLFIIAGALVLVPRVRPALWVLLPWYSASSLMVHPHHLSYFNEIAGGAKNGWKYMVDANIDWGQDLNRLRDYVASSGASDVILSYYGSTVPEAAGFPFQDLYSFGTWGKKDHVNSLTPKKELLAVSVTNLQGVYVKPVLGADGMNWIKEMKPSGRIGYSILVYDITSNARAHEWLSHMYMAGGFADQARREAARALELNPNSVWGLVNSALLVSDGRKIHQAFALFERALKADPTLERIPWDRMTSIKPVQETYSRSLTAMGRALVASGRLRPGVAACNRALMIWPQNLAALETLAAAFDHLGDRQQLQGVLSRVAQLDPNSSLLKHSNSSH